MKLMVKLTRAISTPRVIRKYQSSPTRNNFCFSHSRPPGAGAWGHSQGRPLQRRPVQAQGRKDRGSVGLEQVVQLRGPGEASDSCEGRICDE